MSTDKMTPTPWSEFVSGQYRVLISTVKTGDLLDEQESPNARINARAIVSAINNTYGAGISPEAVPEMLAALKDYEDGTSLSVCFRCLSDLLPKEETNWIEWLNKQGEIIDAVLEKARL